MVYALGSCGFVDIHNILCAYPLCRFRRIDMGEDSKLVVGSGCAFVKKEVKG